MRVLLTGFEAFGTESINPALEVVERVKNRIAEAEIIKLEIPTVFNEAANLVIKTIDEIKPEFVLSLGQAGGSKEINIEYVGINYRDARIKDNKRQQPFDEEIIKGADKAYFSTLPVKQIAKKLLEKQIPAKVSYSAGTFVCNEVLYCTLNFIEENNLQIKCGFIHLPYCQQQIKDKKEACFMTLDEMVKAIEITIETIVTDKSYMNCKW